MVLDLSKYERGQLRMLRIPHADPSFDVKVKGSLDGKQGSMDIQVVGVLSTPLALLIFYIEVAVANG